VLDYCGVAPYRLRAVIQVHGGEPYWAAREIRDLASEAAVAAVSVSLPVRIAPDERNFDPIWAALDATGLPLLHRPTFCARVWTPQRLLRYLSATGVLERFARVRLGFLGGDATWLGRALGRTAGVDDADGGHNGAGLVPGRVVAAVTAQSAPDWSEACGREAAAESLVWLSGFPLGGRLDESLKAIGEVWSGQRRPLLEENPGRFLHRA
jgi:hypothetical protein